MFYGFGFFFSLHFELDVGVLRSQDPVTQREDLRIRVLAHISLLYHTSEGPQHGVCRT